MKKIIIIGVGGFGREVAWLIERINKVQPTYKLMGYVDDNVELQGTMIDSYPVLGDCDWLNNQKEEMYAVCAIGNAKVRRLVINKLDNVKFETIIDPKVEMSDKVSIGEGAIICAGTIITVGINIGNHVIINLDCTIGHDAILKDYVTLYPSVNVSGNTVLGECVEMGTGSQIIQGLEVVSETIIGAGAVVVKDVTESGTYVGMPVRKLD